MDLSQKSDAEILAIANPIMDNLMDASTKIDYERHIRDFSGRLKSMLSRELLERICQDYQNSKGFFAQREFVAVFRRPDSVAVIWQQGFSKQPGEFVAEMVLIQQNGKYLVDHVMVF
jgi:S-adenosylmethionine:diacylglycerol 3-amino-3-carboxypropyl transferase